jgi:hypothetical protein
LLDIRGQADTWIADGAFDRREIEISEKAGYDALVELIVESTANASQPSVSTVCLDQGQGVKERGRVCCASFGCPKPIANAAADVEARPTADGGNNGGRGFGGEPGRDIGGACGLRGAQGRAEHRGDDP